MNNKEQLQIQNRLRDLTGEEQEEIFKWIQFGKGVPDIIDSIDQIFQLALDGGINTGGKVVSDLSYGYFNLQRIKKLLNYLDPSPLGGKP